MTLSEARNVIREYESKNNYSEEEEFEYIEALEFMISSTSDSRYMMALTFLRKPVLVISC